IHMTDYRQRADECRRLADLRAGTEHWAAFLEMAETWEKLASLHEYTQQLKSSGVLLQAPARTYSDKAFSSSANGHSAGSSYMRQLAAWRSGWPYCSSMSLWGL